MCCRKELEYNVETGKRTYLVWQAGRLKTYRNTILGLFSAIMKKNGKSFGRLQTSALLFQLKMIDLIELNM
jgi:hypothetical protein